MDQPIQPGVGNEPQSFKMPENLTPPEPMGGSAPQGHNQQNGENVNVANRPPVNSPQGESPEPPKPPTKAPPPPSPNGNMEMPKRSTGSYLIIIVLIFVLIVGTLFFLSWKGIVKIGFLDEIWGNSKPTISPTISPQISPIVTSSPEVTTNINDETRKSDLAKIKDALKKYYSEKSEYPKAEKPIKLSDSGNIVSTTLVLTYLPSIPNDPQTPQLYYGYKSDGKTFELTAVLEDKTDTSGTLSGNLNIYKITNYSVE